MLEQRLFRAFLVVELRGLAQDRVVARLAQIGEPTGPAPQWVVVEAAADVCVAFLGERLVLVPCGTVGQLCGGDVEDAAARTPGDHVHEAEQVLVRVAEAHAGLVI